MKNITRKKLYYIILFLYFLTWLFCIYAFWDNLFSWEFIMITIGLIVIIGVKNKLSL